MVAEAEGVKPGRQIKADVRLNKNMVFELQPSVKITRLEFSPRIHNGQLVFDIRLPDGAKIKHQKKTDKKRQA